MKRIRLFGVFEVATSEKGEKGAKERVRLWAPNTDFNCGTDGEEYGDIVYEEGSSIPYECVVSHTSVGGEPPSVLVNHSNPDKRYWRAGEHRYMLATDIMLSRLIAASEIDVKDLLVQMLETKSSDATIRIKEGLMEVFGTVNKKEPNIRFGVNSEGYAVMQYFDNNGNFLYDLGPKGISSIDVREQGWLKFRRYYLGTDEETVIQSSGYINVLYNSGEDVYKYITKIVAGVLAHDGVYEGLYYDGNGVDSDGVPTENPLNGWYCSTAPKGATIENYMMYQQDLGLISDLSQYNPPLNFGYDYAIYYKRLEHYSNGVLDKTQNVYWSVKIAAN